VGGKWVAVTRGRRATRRTGQSTTWEGRQLGCARARGEILGEVIVEAKRSSSREWQRAAVAAAAPLEAAEKVLGAFNVTVVMVVAMK